MLGLPLGVFILLCIAGYVSLVAVVTRRLDRNARRQAQDALTHVRARVDRERRL